ncbi:Dolichyl pyrophosphate Man9GlcNAc2 alpha-1,3-glucosyltransferase [Hondaea fermentalgiana]|uniref:Alpha-1,3-glucosyltransferase n=1 Tax=Hondaea fermentalgiana TaxID=2315210 RepID=A0A2R5G8P7_9STRA|nr:Dolichyl pyrophosphate Man9GlcNAc2 alpha-1,3-glucosyltransferase [Hondaea fermentalgiana]|eukprot:GBG27436.1 Dolichyl pyrophosphate Man9GlcNAc2 alpha-1,3-glucosyltransferase [Hondaea fermentalgiana]
MDRAVLHNPVVVALVGLVLRCSVGLHPHGGQGRPPAYGSFEEERHFMAVAVQVPMNGWYGDDMGVCPVHRAFLGEGCLRYPPLAAYASLGFGAVAEKLVPKLVDTTEYAWGFENQDARAYMRATVLICDVLFVFSSAWQFCLLYYRSGRTSKMSGKQLQARKSRLNASRTGAKRHVAVPPGYSRRHYKASEDSGEDDDSDDDSVYEKESPRAATGGGAFGNDGEEVEEDDEEEEEAEDGDDEHVASGDGAEAETFVLYNQNMSNLRHRKGVNTMGSPDENSPNLCAPVRSDAQQSTKTSALVTGPTTATADAPVALVSEVFLIILLQPAYVLIDHGYFQYSDIYVGLVLWTLVLCGQRRYYLAMATLCLSLNFNQVTYHFAPPVIIYLLAQHRGRSGLSRLVYVLSLLSACVLVFGLIWAPLCLQSDDASSCVGVVRRVIRRVAALPQDNVGSPALWSVFPPLTKLANRLPALWVRGVGVFTTIAGLAPSCVDLVRRGVAPGMRRLVWALFNSSLTFVLLATRVDRLAVLLPLMPAALLVGEAPGPSCWFSVMAVFTLSPMLVSEGLGLAYIVSTSVFAGTCAICFRREIFYLPLPWVAARSDAADLDGMRHGMRMVDATGYLRAGGAIALVIHFCAATSSMAGGPGMEQSLWSRAHYSLSCLFLALAWAYGNWYQWMLPSEDETVAFARGGAEKGGSRVIRAKRE